MDTDRIDAVSRALATGHTRRRVTRLLGGVSLGGVLSVLGSTDADAALLTGGSRCTKDSQCKSGQCLGPSGNKECGCSRKFAACKQPSNRRNRASCDFDTKRCVTSNDDAGSGGGDNAPIALGTHISGEFTDLNPYDGFAERVGRMPAIIMWYQPWSADNHWAELRPHVLEGVAARGATPLITWNPWHLDGPVEQPRFALRTIAAGRHDDYIGTWATGLAAYGARVYLRFAPEMNGDWSPWCAGVNGNSAADYVAAWRHVHDRFADAGASNVRWVWCPNVVTATPMADLYPGDAYVDWVALDGYNWGSGMPWGSTWRSFTQVFQDSYAELTTITGKPMMIAETGSAEKGGDKAAWIENAFTQLADSFPKIRAFLWYNVDRRSADEPDFRVESSPASLEAFRTVAGSAYARGTLE
jgi:Glycosyl hydrolase family 26